MADSAVPITSGIGTNIDTRTESTNGNHRQVITIGDPATNAGVAPVDATAGLKVDLGADNDVTVTGTVTAELSATDNAVLDNIDADLTTIIGHVDGAEGLLTTIDADTSNISTKIDTIAGDTTSIQTAVELIDDTVYTDGTGTVTKGIAILGQDGTNPQAIKTDANGELQVDVLTMPTVAVTNAGITTIAGAVSGTEMQVDVLTMPTTTVQATNLDIRDLTAASDSVAVHGDVGAIDQLDLTNSNPVTVAIVDATGDQITSFGGGTQYTEGDTDTTITGTALMFESNTGTNTISAVSSSSPLPVTLSEPLTDDSSISIHAQGSSGQVAVTATDDGYLKTHIMSAEGNLKIPVTVTSILDDDSDSIMDNANDALRVSIVAGGGTGGTASADDADFTATTTSGTPAMGVYESSPTSVTDGDMGIVGITAGRRLKTSATIDTALPAGTNAIGKLASNDGVDIGDVTATNLPATVDTNSGNKSASTLRVVLATDQPALTNKLLVTPDLPSGASSLAEQQSQTTHLATIAGDTTNIETSVQLIDDTVATTASAITSKGIAMAGTDGTNARILKTDTSGELQVDVVGALPAGTNAIGKLSANSGVDIGDVDVTSVIAGTGATNLGKAEDAGHTTGDTGVYVLGVRNNTPNTATTNADSDYSQLSTDMVGGIRTALYETDFAVLGTNHVKKYYTNAGAVTDGIVWSPAAGKRWYVTDLIINVSAAATVTFEDDKAGGDEVVLKLDLAANSGITHHFATPLFSGEDAADLLVTTSAGNIYCTVCGYEV